MFTRVQNCISNNSLSNNEQFLKVGSLNSLLLTFPNGITGLTLSPYRYDKKAEIEMRTD